jgi:hypothetical protein
LFALALAPAPAPTGPTETAEVGVVEKKERDPTVFPDPRKFSRGFFVEGSTGPLVPVGPTAEVLSVGFSLTGRVGYEIRRWIGFGGHVMGSVSKYDDGVLGGQLLQQYVYTGEVRFGIPFRRFLIAIQGGAGAWHVSNNLLQVAGIADSNLRIGLAWDAGLAFDIHSLNRHFSGGVLATFVGMPALQNAGAIAIQVYFRYTL